MMQDYTEFMDEVLVDQQAIDKRVRELGEQISRDYAGEDLVVVCLLRGGLTFTADLTRHLSLTHELDCMSLSSYGTGHYASSGNVRVNLDLMTNIEGRNVLWVHLSNYKDLPSKWQRTIVRNLNKLESCESDWLSFVSLNTFRLVQFGYFDRFTEVISFADFIAAGGETQAKRAGKLRLELKQYVVQDYDLLNFRFNK